MWHRIEALERAISDLLARLFPLENRVNALEQLAQMLGRGQSSRPTGGSGLILAKTGVSGITARSGTTMGSATVTLQYVSAGAISAGGTETCYNFSGTAADASKYIWCNRQSDGSLYLVSQEC